jgi:hypothetical protein
MEGRASSWTDRLRNWYFDPVKAAEEFREFDFGRFNLSFSSRSIWTSFSRDSTRANSNRTIMTNSEWDACSSWRSERFVIIGQQDSMNFQNVVSNYQILAVQHFSDFAARLRRMKSAKTKGFFKITLQRVQHNGYSVALILGKKSLIWHLDRLVKRLPLLVASSMIPIRFQGVFIVEKPERAS